MLAKHIIYHQHLLIHIERTVHILLIVEAYSYLDMYLDRMICLGFELFQNRNNQHNVLVYLVFIEHYMHLTRMILSLWMVS